MTAADKEAVMALVKQCADKLGEHCDSLIIMVTCPDGDTTWSYKKGGGNAYARLYLAHEYLMEDRANTHHNMKPNPPEDSEDSWKQ
jgi:hypothetical protein